MGEGPASRYSNAGLHAAEALFTAAHPRAGQYLDQAPVLVMWSLPWVASMHDSAQTFARAWIIAHCEDGIALKDFLRSASFTAPMRAISAKVLIPRHAGTYRMLARVNPAVLGQSIPATIRAQRAWLRALDAWLGASRRKRLLIDIDTMFSWCVVRFSDTDITPSQASDLLDFQNTSEFNRSWGLKRAREEMHEWHTRLTLDRALAGLPISADTEIDFGKHIEMEIEGYRVTPLRTPRQITEEGTEMRHCVATYLKRVMDGHSHIVSITKNDKRVATLDFGRSFQLRGPRNTPVSQTVASLASFYVEQQRSPKATTP